MTLEALLTREDDGKLLDIYKEISEGIVPATGYTHSYIRKVNRMIDAGDLQINRTSYRKVYLPTFAKAIKNEMSRRYAYYLTHLKGPVHYDVFGRGN